LAISGWVRRHNAAQSVQTLRQLLSADARFAKVQVLRSTNAKVWLDGEVASADALAALHRLVTQAHLPAQPEVLAHVHNAASNQAPGLIPGNYFPEPGQTATNALPLNKK
jgi:hypothetical protein